MKARVEMDTYSLKMYSQYIDPKWVVRPVTIVCGAWKYLGKKKVHNTSVLDDMTRFNKCSWDDLHVVKELHKMITDADILVAHNGDKFDWKVFIGRCMYHDLPPPPKPLMIDTLKSVRKEAMLLSNKLSYLAEHFELGEKGQTPNWDKIAQGDIKEIRRCVKYNKQDVTEQEKLYLRLRPYMTNHPNTNVMRPEDGCQACGSSNLVTSKTRKTKTGVKVQYQCKDCGSYTTTGKNIKTAELR